MKKKQNDCVELKNEIQKELYEKYKNMTDEEREAAITRKLNATDSPIAAFWRSNALHVAEKRAEYKRKDK